MRLGVRLSRGTAVRGVLAWVCAVVAASLTAAFVTVAYALVRESILHGPFPLSNWWVFLNLWRPMVIGALVLGAIASAIPTVLGVWVLKQQRWPRPAGDIVAGATVGVVSVGTVILLLRLVGPMSEGA